MASLTRTISIKFPTDPQQLAALRAQAGLSAERRRNRASPDHRTSHPPHARGFLTFGKSPPSGLNLPYQGDIS